MKRKNLIYDKFEIINKFDKLFEFKEYISNLKYKVDFYLGDRVTCIDKKWGVTINSRITEIVQTFEEGKRTIEATFGESAPNLLEKIKKAR